jgi:hypothetical protein
MQVNWILFSAICLFGFCTLTEEAFGSQSLQSFINKFVDVDKFKVHGILSLNHSSTHHIWNFFKTKYGRIYSSTGLV